LVSTALTITTSAFAGTGIGQVLNLGSANRVNAPTELSGSVAGKQLSVANSSDGSAATGIGISVHSGKPPLTVNSPTKVNNLNADLLDGLDSSTFQRRVTGQCTNRTAVSAVNADGTVGCTSFAVYPIYHSMSIGSPDASDTFAGSGLILGEQCLNSIFVDLAFTSSNTSTLNEMYNIDGQAMPTVDSQQLSPGKMSEGLDGTQLGGQVIWVTTTGTFPFYTRWIVTINIHESVSASGCEYSGTAEVVTSPYRVGIPG